nr:LysR family transcriptional regulator [Nostoc sp. 'Peltigera membranacea cyanobiont' 232]
MDKLKSLMIFIRSAQSGSFSEAARHLGMAPSAVSRAVLRLEDDLGVRLLQRTTRSLTLTEDGNRFYQRSEQILNDLEEAELEVKQSQSMPLGTLRLDLSFVFGKIHIAPALLQFVTQYPKLNLNVSFNDRTIDLIEEGIDATVRIGMSSDSRLIMHHLATAHYATSLVPHRSISLSMARPQYPQNFCSIAVSTLSIHRLGESLNGSLNKMEKRLTFVLRVICDSIIQKSF